MGRVLTRENEQMNDADVKNLASAITLQAVKDYFQSAEKGKKTILKDLRSPWMIMLTNDASVVVAEQLEKHPEEIRERLRRNGELRK
jgi:broad-specificity NMP kinase